MERLNYAKASPQAFKAWVALEHFIAESSIEHSLVELVKLRASQINGCAFCIDMHTADARRHGETERRLYLVSAWRETTLFTPRERAALAWTETMTRLSDNPRLDGAYANLQARFSEREMVDLTALVSVINGWNRFAVGFGAMPPA